MKNNNYHTADVINRCWSKLKISFKKPSRKRSDHFNGWFSLEGKKIKRITIAKGRKPIPPKTYKSMANQLGLTVDQFDNLLDCPLKYDGYLRAIKITGSSKK